MQYLPGTTKQQMYVAKFLLAVSCFLLATMGVIAGAKWDAGDSTVPAIIAYCAAGVAALCIAFCLYTEYGRPRDAHWMVKYAILFIIAVVIICYLALEEGQGNSREAAIVLLVFSGLLCLTSLACFCHPHQMVAVKGEGSKRGAGMFYDIQG
jgi:hypothetical protein